MMRLRLRNTAVNELNVPVGTGNIFHVGLMGSEVAAIQTH
jgi:hypothetical protein